MNTESLVRKAYVFASTNRYKVSWEDICNHLGVECTDGLKLVPVSYINIGAILPKYLEEKLHAPKDKSDLPIKVQPLSEIKDTWKLGRFKLSPEQQSVVNALIKGFYEQEKRALYNDGTTGIGKTLVAVALTKYILDNKLDKRTISIAPTVLVLTAKSVIELWYRHYEEAGLAEHIGREILVTNYSALTSSELRHFFSVKETEEEIIYEWLSLAIPHLVVFDEAHMLNRRDSLRHKIAMALVKYPDVKILCLSATPFTVVNDARFFACASRAKYNNIEARPTTFDVIARDLAKDPARPNKMAAGRLREWLSPHIVSFPRVAWKHRAVNTTVVVDFTSDRGREVYEKAYNRFLERYKKMGKEARFGRWELAVALNQYRYAAEPLRMEQIIDLALKEVNQYAPVIGCAFKKSIVRALFKVIEHGYTRDDVSIIWGGFDNVDTKRYLSREQMEELFNRMVQGDELTDEELKNIQQTLLIEEQQIVYEDLSPEDTIARLNKLKDWGLTGQQSVDQRQQEIDKFQSGKSKMCFMTIASGGVGLSLDRWKEDLLPRKGYFTPTYNGYEMRQALGRLVRRYTVGERTFQYIVGLRGTVEETHVLPLIEEKLKCLSKVTNTDLDIVKGLLGTEARGRIRTLEEAVRDAEREETQLWSEL